MKSCCEVVVDELNWNLLFPGAFPLAWPGSADTSGIQSGSGMLVTTLKDLVGLWCCCQGFCRELLISSLLAGWASACSCASGTSCSCTSCQAALSSEFRDFPRCCTEWLLIVLTFREGSFLGFYHVSICIDAKLLCWRQPRRLPHRQEHQRQLQQCLRPALCIFFRLHPFYLCCLQACFCCRCCS